MLRFVRGVLILAGFALGFAGEHLAAQENLDAGKKPAQLFVNDCSGCHRSPVGLSEASGWFGLESFLREHYTASRQSAAAIANYLRAVDAEQAARAPAKRRKSEPRSRTAGKPAKPADSKAAEPSAPKADSKADAKPAADKPAADKPAADKPAEPKAADAKASAAKPVEAKPADSKPAEPPAAPAPAANSSPKTDNKPEKAN